MLNGSINDEFFIFFFFFPFFHGIKQENVAKLSN